MHMLPRLLLLLVLAAKPTEVTLRWTLSPKNPAPPAVHTRVYRGPSPCNARTKYKLMVTGINGASWTDETVTAGATYCYFTTVRNPKTGLESGRSNVFQITVP